MKEFASGERKSKKQPSNKRKENKLFLLPKDLGTKM